MATTLWKAEPQQILFATHISSPVLAILLGIRQTFTEFPLAHCLEQEKLPMAALLPGVRVLEWAEFFKIQSSFPHNSNF